MDSILDSIKKMLGIETDCVHFDYEIIMHINSVLMITNQLGIGPETGFSISNNEPTWKDFIGDRIDLEAIKTYVYLKVKLIFDPPSLSSMIESIDRQLTQLEWRLNLQAEPIEVVEEEDEDYG
jgi:hypothetical protein